MALKHAHPGQPIDLAPLGPALHKAATHAILKTHALELIRVVLREGDALPPHQLRGELTLQCIEGAVEVTLDGSRCALGPAQVVLLPAHMQHAVHALEDSSLLLTLHIPPGMPGSGSSTG